MSYASTAPQGKILDTVWITAYKVCLESELDGDKTGVTRTVTDSTGTTGTFYAEFLYSAYGVCMQGSGCGDAHGNGGITIHYVSGGNGWVNTHGEPTYYLPRENRWSNGPPYWIRDESSVFFETLPAGEYPGAYGHIHAWHSIAVDPNVIAPHSREPSILPFYPENFPFGS